MIGDFFDDPDVSLAQAEVGRSVDAATLEQIDRAILSHANQRGRKIAMITMLAMDTVHVPGLVDLFYIHRIKDLVRRGRLEVALGNLDQWPGCEVRLPEGGT